MTRIPVHELPEDMLPWVERARRGEVIEVTENDMVIARIVPPVPQPLGGSNEADDLRPPVLPGPIPPLTSPGA